MMGAVSWSATLDSVLCRARRNSSVVSEGESKDASTVQPLLAPSVFVSCMLIRDM